jgi:uncharacterized protein
MKVFFDTSAFVKRYVEESGSDQVQDICANAESVVLSVICFPEMISTLNRLVREGKFTEAHYAEVKQSMGEDLQDILFVNLTPSVIGRAVRLLEKNPLRAMDALHLASAVETKTDLFVSADDRQIDAARRAGLPVVDVSR